MNCLADIDWSTWRACDPATLVFVFRGDEILLINKKTGLGKGKINAPGGKVDPADGVAESRCRGRNDPDASELLGMESGGLAFWIAAVRECFEEAGVLLAYDDDGEILDFGDQEREDMFKGLRDQLNAGDTSILDIAEQQGLTVQHRTRAGDLWERSQRFNHGLVVGKTSGIARCDPHVPLLTEDLAL